MLGFYDYTVILTYLSLGSSMLGIFLTFSGHLHLAITCLAISGLLDTFDGKVARTKKTGQKKKSALAFKLIPSAMSSALAYSQPSFVITPECENCQAC